MDNARSKGCRHIRKIMTCQSGNIIAPQLVLPFQKTGRVAAKIREWG